MFLREIILSGVKNCFKKCPKFKVPKMPKVKDFNHFITDSMPQL
jgi:hypothetical protein